MLIVPRIPRHRLVQSIPKPLVLQIQVTTAPVCSHELVANSVTHSLAREQPRLEPSSPRTFDLVVSSCSLS